MKPFVVAGSYHSATQWASVVLTTAGIPCGHEAFFRPIAFDCRRWLAHGGDASGAAWRYLDKARRAGGAVIHLVRDPAQVLRDFPNSMWNAARLAGRDREAVYLAENGYIALWADVRVRAEDGPEALIRAVEELTGAHRRPNLGPATLRALKAPINGRMSKAMAPAVEPGPWEIRSSRLREARWWLGYGEGDHNPSAKSSASR